MTRAPAHDDAVRRALDRIGSMALPNGGFPARGGASFDPAATAWAAMALAGAADDLAGSALVRLADAQEGDGGVRLSPDHPNAVWPTYPALLAFSTRADRRPQASRAADFLLRLSGRTWPRRPDDATAHDTSLRGWPWVAGTHSWVEPTALAVLGLKAMERIDQSRSDHASLPDRVDLVDHDHRASVAAPPDRAGGDAPSNRLHRRQRMDEAVRLLLDRQLPAGGWNYGNTVVFGAEQLPAPDSTGAALAALAGSVPASAVARGVEYLRATLPGLLAPLSLSWALLGLSAWDAVPAGAHDAVPLSLARQDRYGGYDATLLSMLAVAWRTRDGSSPFPRQGAPGGRA